MRIVYHCADAVGARMAGPGIRAVELARRLATRHDVTLVAPGAASAGLPGAAPSTGARGADARLAVAEPAALASLLRGAEVFITQGFDFPLPLLLRFRGRLVLDLYDPVQLEHLARLEGVATPDQQVALAYLRRRLQYLVSRADHVLCASAPQRALWLGWLGACGRLAPEALLGDPEARRLLAVVPFGVPEAPPRRDGTPLRAACGLAAGDRVALWSGGLWDWMDPALAVRAAALVRAQVPHFHLALLAGTRPGAQQMRAAADAARLAAHELPFVHFVNQWVEYEGRGAWLLDADLAVSAHKPSLEAELAFRTRLLDCLWAALPAACTAGDVLADEGARQGWARTAPPGDAAALASAMLSLCTADGNARAREAARASAASRTWSRSADTLLALLDAPAPARASAFSPAMAMSAARKVLQRLRK